MTNNSPKETQELPATTPKRRGILVHANTHQSALMADHLGKEYIREMRKHRWESSSVKMITDMKWHHIPLVRLKGTEQHFVIRDTEGKIWTAPAIIDRLRRIGGHWDIVTWPTGEVKIRWTDIVSSLRDDYRYAEFTLDETMTKKYPFFDWQASARTR